MSSTDYEAAPYDGDEWGIFHRPTRNWSIFGTREEMQTRAAELNAGEKPAGCTCGPVRHWECNAGCRARVAP